MSLGNKKADQQYDQQNQLFNAQMNALNQSNELQKLQAEDYKKFRPQINELQELSLGQSKADLESPVWNQQRSLGETIMGTVKDYQPIGFENPTVKAVQGYLDDNAMRYAKEAVAMDDAQSAARGDFGSSYRARAKAELGEKLARMGNENALNALNTGSQIYNTNMGLVDWGFGNRTDVPTIQAPSLNVPSVSIPQYQSGGNTAGQLFGSVLTGLAGNPSLFGGFGKGGGTNAKLSWSGAMPTYA